MVNGKVAERSSQKAETFDTRDQWKVEFEISHHIDKVLFFEGEVVSVFEGN